MDWLERLNRQTARIPLGDGVIEVLNWSYAFHLPDNVPHRHTFFEICQVGQRGQGQFIVQEEAYAIGPGSLFIARPGVVHQIVNTAAPNMELYWVCFQWLPATGSEDEINTLLRAFAEAETLVVADDEGRIAALWQALRAVSEGRLRPGQANQTESLIAALLLAIAQAGTGPRAPQVMETTGRDPGDLAARSAIRYIHDNLYRPLGLPEIAAHIHVSPRQLCRLFAHFAGTSPAAYITRARLDRACGLLLHSETPIKEIAASIGYADVHYFTRIFTQQFGCPPGAFRRHGGAEGVANIQKPGALV